MEHVSVTTLRTNIYKLVDKVLATGEPLIIERGGKCPTLMPGEAVPQGQRRKQVRKQMPEDIFARLEPHPGVILGNLEESPSWDEKAWSAQWDALLRGDGA